MKVENISISKIDIKENTRGKIDKIELGELKNSIREVGLLQPIGVEKKSKDKYELVWGFRRLVAHKELGINDISSIIVDSDNGYGLKIIENLQRKDIEPLDLALAIKKYRETSGLALTEIAKVLGKSLNQVALINKLNDLIKPLQELLKKGVLELDAAYFIARYPEDAQKECCSSFNREDRIILSDIKQYFDNEVVKLKTFPWALDKKFKSLTACKDCNERSSQEGVLFPVEENKDDTCLNRKCFEKKIVQNLNDVIKETKKENKIIFVSTDRHYYKYNFEPEGKKIVYKDSIRMATKTDKNFIYGIIVKSDSITDIGQVHKYVVKKTTSESRSSGKTRMENLSLDQQKKRRIENYKRKKDLLTFPMAAEVGKEITNQIKSLNLTKVKTIPTAALAVIADYVYERAEYETHNKLMKIYKQKKDKKNLAKIYLMLVIAATQEGYINVDDERYAGSSRYRRIREITAPLGIDLKAIEKKIKPKYDEKVNTLKERFIGRNKFDPEKKQTKKK